MSGAPETEIYQGIIAVLVLVCAYLFFRVERLKQSVRESQQVNMRPAAQSSSVADFREQKGDTSAAAQEKTEDTAPDEEAEKEYTFEDPDFALPPLLPAKSLKGRVEGEHGDAIYGALDRYHKEDYIGRVSHGAELELKDCRVYKNEFELNIIKVLVLRNEWETEIGKIGWVGLDDTSFRSMFNPKRRIIDG